MHPCSLCSFFILIILTIGSVTNAEESPSGNSVIRSPALGSEIVITTTSRLAGAVHSLTWNGREFINSVDHGRQLQSAANFDLQSRFSGETFNPTEAGSRNDGAGENSTSRLLHFVAQKNVLQTTTQMAFWLAPGQKSRGRPAKNSKLLSDHLLTKRVRIGIDGFSHVIQYDVTFSMPVTERHNYAQFEAVTGYMPPDFSAFWKFNPKTEKLEPLSDGPGEQSMPVVLATKNGSHAMGVFSPDQPSKGYEEAGYGRFRFEKQKVVKWNCVFRIRDLNGVEPGDYSFRSFVIVGDLRTVSGTLAALLRRFAK